MTAMEIRAIIAKACQLPSDSWPDEASIYEVGIDSLALAALIAHCEESLSLDLGDNSIMRIMASRTVGQLIQELQAVLAADPQIPA